ncbi:hypothetical protein MUN78_16135 [Leucobacter allii]|uniref:Uncharacterized protein n=1 Tax=Leucobacter allii TaxID=2932247 RepID=A0ABY4FLL6_9MICO|nr:hypothetical protein [Leucobacter allii]UOQ57160.1 hypothetical protein MUN78_16135 [Leucobacter allii]
MVDRAHLLAYRTGALTDAELERAFRIAGPAGGALLDLPEIARWRPESATRLEFDALSVAQLVTDRPAPLRVLRDGRELAAR